MPLYRAERDAGPDGGEKRLGFYNSPASGPHAAHLQTFDKRGEDFSREKERWGTGERKRRKEKSHFLFPISPFMVRNTKNNSIHLQQGPK